MAYIINGTESYELEFRSRHSRKISHPYILDQMEEFYPPLTQFSEDIFEESSFCAGM